MSYISHWFGGYTLPINIFIREILERNNLKKVDLVKLLGYINTNKGLKVIDEISKGDFRRKDIIEKMKAVFGEESTKLDEAIEESWIIIQKRMDDHDRAIFKPHIEVATASRRPSSITMAGLTGGADKFLGFHDEFYTLPRAEQIQKAKERALRHYKESKGRTAYFGKALGYDFKITFDETIRLALELPEFEDVGSSCSVCKHSS